MNKSEFRLVETVSAPFDTSDFNGESEEVTFEELCCSSWEYRRIKRKIRDTLKVNVEKIEEIKNPYLWGAFELKKLECMTRKPGCYSVEEYFHATGQDAILSIAEDNLDWRRVWRAKYGRGVSFSPYAAYGNTHANYDCGDKRAMLIVDVLVDDEECRCASPDEDCDTSKSYDGNVVVKFQDNEFYPKYVAYYKDI